MKKKILSVLLAAAMLGTAAQSTAFAAVAALETAAQSDTTGDCTWTLDDDGTLTISGNGEMGNYGDFESAAPWKNSVKRVVVENGVTNIGKWAFTDCENMTEVTLPDTVVSIEEYAFSGCENLTKLTLSKGLVTIGYCAFGGCSGLKSITIPSSVEYIMDGAFNGCQSLTGVVIPEHVREIGYGAFGYCDNLTSLAVSEDNHYYDSRENCNAIIETAANKLCHGIKTTVIPGSVKTIGSNAFEGCSGLKTVSIPHGVESVKFDAFVGCENLESVYISDTVTHLSNSSFSNALGKLHTVVIDSDNPVYDSRDNCNAIIHTEDNALIFGCGGTVIPDGVARIGCQAFADCDDLTSITIPGSVKLIDEGAFYACSKLTEVVMNDGVEDIRSGAFNSCCNLASIVVPDSVKYIKSDAFGWILDERMEHMLYCSKNSTAYSFAVENEIPSFLTDYEVKGDFNFDGKITVEDATEIQRSLAEFSAAPNAKYSAVIKLGDINCDGKFNVLDVSEIQRKLAEQ